MKSIIFIIAAVAFTACSSAKKTETATTTTEAPTTVEKSTTETMSSDMDSEKMTKKSKKQKMAATENSSAPSADGSGFPSITGTEKSSVTCSSKSDTRKITTLNVTDGGCGVVYNKMGEDKTVALAKVDMNYCDTVTNKIKTNLEGAGFNCGGAGSSSDTPAAAQ